jgi:hypothetical protein
LRYLKERFPKVGAVQLTTVDGIDFTNNDGIRVVSLVSYLSTLQ